MQSFFFAPKFRHIRHGVLYHECEAFIFLPQCTIGAIHVACDNSWHSQCVKKAPKQGCFLFVPIGEGAATVVLAIEIQFLAFFD